jgi:hypothetical protein
VIGEYKTNLAPPSPDSLALRQRQIEIVVLVDDISGGLECLLRVDADLRAGAGQRIDTPIVVTGLRAERIGAGAAAAWAPSNTLRRVIVI